MDTVVEIGGKQIRMRANARIPYLYRRSYGKDLFAELRELGKNEGYELIERLGFLMAREAGDESAEGLAREDELGEWLSNFGVFDIRDAAADIIKAFGAGNQTASTAKKK